MSEMTNKQIPREISEAMGLCWHEWGWVPEKDKMSRIFPRWTCSCGAKTYHYFVDSIEWVDGDCNTGIPVPYGIRSHPQLDPTSETDFFRVFRWAKEQEWWKDFTSCLPDSPDMYSAGKLISVNFIDPEKFMTALANFLEWKEKEDE